MIAVLGVICILFSSSVLLTFAIAVITFVLGLIFVRKIPKITDDDKDSIDK